MTDGVFLYRVLGRRFDWSLAQMSDGSLRICSPYAGVWADVSRPADVARVLDDAGGHAGADVVCMLADLLVPYVGDDYHVS